MGVEGFLRIRRIGDRGPLAVKRLQAVQDDQACLQTHKETGHAARGIKDQRHANHEGDNRSAVHIETRVERHVATHANDQNVNDGRQNVDRRAHQGLHCLQANCQTSDFRRGFIQTHSLYGFLIGNLDRAHAIAHLFNARHVIAHGILSTGLYLFNAVRDVPHKNGHCGHDKDHQQKQQGIFPRQVARDNNHSDGIARRINGSLPNEATEILGLVDQAQNNLARFGAFKVC